ncbi:MAG: hypothetical protein GX601_06230 [Anaerolineales bacterium]|nr:hypothetical protein [Anaerolineales bacterium]
MTTLAELKARYRQEAGVDFEADAEALLAADWRADPAAWAQAWAALAERAGWPCWGMSWRAWAGDVRRQARRREDDQSS